MMRKLIAGIVVLLVIIVAGGFWLRGNLDGIAREAIARFGSQMTGARVTVGAVALQTVDSRGVIRDLTIGNPPGFRTAHALKVARIEVEIDVGSITGDVVAIRRIAILAPDVIFEQGASMTNFEALQKNINAFIGPAAQDAKPGGGKKLIVERLTVRDAKVQTSTALLDGKAVAVPMPDISLRDIGKAKGGVTPGELGKTIADAIAGSLTSAIRFDRLRKGAGTALEGAGNAARQAGGAIRNLFK